MSGQRRFSVMARWVRQKNPVRVDADHQGIVLGGVVGKRIGDVDAGLVTRVSPC
jgi:hypothetical protein